MLGAHAAAPNPNLEVAGMIHVVATISLADGEQPRFLRAFRELVPQVTAETGCIEYGPTVDVDAALPDQPPPRVDVMTVMEKWESLEALHAHLQAPHMAAFRESVQDIVLGIEIRVFEPA
ncbi:MAG: antibiotic biosynthesis monooxygenase family protein [Planctomycetota bacterium]